MLPKAKKSLFILSLAVAVVLPNLVSAVSCPGNWLFNIINNLLYMVIWPVFVAISIGMFIWAGFLYLTAQGDTAKVSLAHKAVLMAVLGIFIVLMSFIYMNSLGCPAVNNSGGGNPPGGGNTPNQGACCDVLGDCTVQTQDTCSGIMGSYKGNGSVCTPSTCAGNGNDNGAGDNGGGGDWGDGGPTTCGASAPACNGTCPGSQVCQSNAGGCSCFGVIN